MITIEAPAGSYTNAAEKAMMEALMAASARCNTEEARAANIAEMEANAAKRNAAKGRDFKAKACTRCNGRGDLSTFRHVCGGVCFRCNGSGNEYNA